MRCSLILTQRISYIFFILGDNLSPCNYCMHVLVLIIIFQHVNAFQELKQNKCMEAQIVFFLVNGYIFAIRHRKQVPVLYNMLNKSHTRIVFITSCGEQYKMEPSSLKGEEKCIPNFLPYTAHLLFLTWNRVGLSEGLGVCFADSTLVVRECKVGWRGGLALLREPEVQGVSSRQSLLDVNVLNNNLNRSVINICNQNAVLND